MDMPLSITCYSKLKKKRHLSSWGHTNPRENYSEDSVPSLTGEETEAQQGNIMAQATRLIQTEVSDLPRCYFRTVCLAFSLYTDCFRKTHPLGTMEPLVLMLGLVCVTTTLRTEQMQPPICSCSAHFPCGDLEFRIQILSGPKKLGQHSLINNEVQLRLILFWSLLNAQAKCLKLLHHWEREEQRGWEQAHFSTETPQPQVLWEHCRTPSGFHVNALHGVQKLFVTNIGPLSICFVLSDHIWINLNKIKFNLDTLTLIISTTPNR